MIYRKSSKETLPATSTQMSISEVYKTMSRSDIDFFTNELLRFKLELFRKKQSI